MIRTTYESRYLLINFITEYKILIYSLNSNLDKLNQITLTRRPISSCYFLKLLKEVYNVNSNTIIGVTGNFKEKGKYFSLLLGYAEACNIRIRKLDFYQSCERVNARYKIMNSTNKIIDWYKKYYIIYTSLITKKSIKFINDEFLNIIENRTKKEIIIFKKSLILLLYIHVREVMYNSTKKSICKKKGITEEIIEDIKLSENSICVID